MTCYKRTIVLTNLLNINLYLHYNNFIIRYNFLLWHTYYRKDFLVCVYPPRILQNSFAFCSHLTFNNAVWYQLPHPFPTLTLNKQNVYRFTSMNDHKTMSLISLM